MANNKLNLMIGAEGRAYHLLKTAKHAGETVAAMSSEMFNELSEVNNRFFDGVVDIECFETPKEYVDDLEESPATFMSF